MEAAAHTKGGYGGVSQAVGKEFVKADEHRGRDEASEPDYEQVSKEALAKTRAAIDGFRKQGWEEA
jgi:hypothetical protein